MPTSFSLYGEPGGSIHGKLANSTRFVLVVCMILSKPIFCKQILVGIGILFEKEIEKLLTRSNFCTAPY